MKKLIYPLMFLLVVVNACKKDESSPASNNQVGSTNLPIKATQYIAQNFPDNSINSAVKLNDGTNTYIVTLNSQEQLAFDVQGTFLGQGYTSTNPANPIPTQIAPDAVVTGGIAELAPGKILNVRYLPWTIGLYLRNNYDGYTVQLQQLQNICTFGTVYVIMLEQNKSVKVTLLFYTDGQYLAKGEIVPYTMAPKSVQQNIAASFPEYTVRVSMDQIVTNDGRTILAVFLVNQGHNFLVMSNVDGMILCSQEII
jgi:hypothetical protein